MQSSGVKWWILISARISSFKGKSEEKFEIERWGFHREVHISLKQIINLDMMKYFYLINILMVSEKSANVKQSMVLIRFIWCNHYEDIIIVIESSGTLWNEMITIFISLVLYQSFSVVNKYLDDYQPRRFLYIDLNVRLLMIYGFDGIIWEMYRTSSSLMIKIFSAVWKYYI